MVENRKNIQTRSTKRTGFQACRVLLFEQVIEKNENAVPSENQKSAIFPNTTDNNKIINTNKLLKKNVHYIAPFLLKISLLSDKK
jgi:hypothetical protein